MRYCFVLVQSLLFVFTLAGPALAAPDAKSAPAKKEDKASPRLAPKADARPVTRAAAPAPRKGTKAAPKDVNESFKPVDLSKMKKSPHWDRPYMLAAYAIVWLLFMFYVFQLARRVNTTDKQLAQIEARLRQYEEEED